MSRLAIVGVLLGLSSFALPELQAATAEEASVDMANQDGSVVRVAGVGINVADLDRSARFYTEVLGLKEIMRVPSAEHPVEVVLSLTGQLTDTLVVLAKLNDEPLAAGRADFGRIIMNVNDARAVIARAAHAGAKVVDHSQGTTVRVLRGRSRWLPGGTVPGGPVAAGVEGPRGRQGERSMTNPSICPTGR